MLLVLRGEIVASVPGGARSTTVSTAPSACSPRVGGSIRKRLGDYRYVEVA
jgi:hypothetical protein